MLSERQLIMRWFYGTEFQEGILEFDELLNGAVVDGLKKTRADAESYTYANCKRHWDAFLENIDLDRRLGRSSVFKVEDYYSRRISWVPSNIGRIKSQREKYRALKLRARPFFIKMIETLSARKYEALGCVISQLAGATHVQLTPEGNEGGIDFFALINSPAGCHVFGGECRPLRVIGQSKKYSEKAKVDKIKEMIETIEEVRKQSTSIEPLVPPWFRSSSGPVVGWFIAHNGVQSGGITKARNHGIIVSDSIDLAEVASLSKKIDCNLSGSERVVKLDSMVAEMV